MRVKTVWFKKEGVQRSPGELATVVASTIWRLSDTTVSNLSRADYDIITPQRGFGIIAEMLCFLAHYADRLVYGRVAQDWRAEFVSALGIRLAEVTEQNVRELVGADGHDYRADFIAKLNRRSGEYAEFEFAGGEPDFPALRCLGHAVREMMTEQDQKWVVAQIMEVEAPNAAATLKKQVQGLLKDVPAHAG